MDSSSTAVIASPDRAAVERPSWSSTLRRSLSDAPLFPLIILSLLVFTAIFADLLCAPRSLPSATSDLATARRSGPNAAVADYRAGHRPHGAGRVEPHHPWLPHFPRGRDRSGAVGGHVIGTTMGILSGYRGGWIDQVVMRITDAWMALPTISFAILTRGAVAAERVESGGHLWRRSTGRATPASSGARCSV